MQRMIDCGTWDDPWFADLAPDGKLVFLYLLTNRRSTAAGAFEITIRAMAFETGIDQERIQQILDSFGDRVQWWPEYQVIWIRNFYKRQAVNDKFMISAQRHIANLPTEVQCLIATVYPDLVAEGVSPVQDTPESPDDTHTIPTATGMDTNTLEEKSNSNSGEVGEKEGKKEGKKEDSGADAPQPSGSPPFDLLESLCDTLGQDVSVLSNAEKNKQLAVAKRLVDAGMSAQDVASMTRWLKAQSWVTGGIDLFFLEKQLGKWQLAGKPTNLTHIRSPNGRDIGLTNAELEAGARGETA